MDEDVYPTPEPEPVRPIALALNDNAVYIAGIVAAALVLIIMICGVTVTSLWGRWQPW